MAHLAKRLIDAMRIAVDLRINKISDFIVGDNSGFVRAAYDLTFLELGRLGKSFGTDHVLFDSDY